MNYFLKLCVSLFTVITLSTVSANAQESGFSDFLSVVENNNTGLRALRGSADAEQMANKTGLNPANPEVGFNYLNISPIRRKRTDFSITQTIDFPTAYIHRRKLADARSTKATLDYETRRIGVLHEAASSYVSWVYSERLAEQLEKRRAIAKQLADAYQRSFEAGEISVLERNKARVNLLNAEKEAELNDVERAALKAELVRLNGGHALESLRAEYPGMEIPVDFDTWYAEAMADNPSLQVLDQYIAISEQQEKLNRALSLPSIRGGYMTEEDADAKFSGITLGLTVPLWQQRNTVKQAKLEARSAELYKADAVNRFLNDQQRLFNRAKALETVYKDLKRITEDTQGPELIKRALDLGELSLLDYLVELTMYYETMDKLMETERDLQFTLAELYQWVW